MHVCSVARGPGGARIAQPIAPTRTHGSVRLELVLAPALVAVPVQCQVGSAKWDRPSGIGQVGSAKWDRPSGIGQVGSAKWDRPSGRARAACTGSRGCCASARARPLPRRTQRRSLQARGPGAVWQGRAQSRCRCGRGEPSPGADVAGVSPVPVPMWRGQKAAQYLGRCRPPQPPPRTRGMPKCPAARAKLPCRCGRRGPTPGADVAGASPVPVQMWQG
jgi:hypothetical protein